ncbi:MAG: hypothetical protein IPK53_00010 [bacterium]|nr:hypothetical protein [bacterium]
MTIGRKIQDNEFHLLEWELNRVADLLPTLSPFAESTLIPDLTGDEIITVPNGPALTPVRERAFQSVPDTEQPHWLVQRLMPDIHKLTCLNWDTIEYGNINSRSRRAFMGKPAKIRGSIQSLSTVSPLFCLPVELDVASLEIRDDNGDVMESSLICAPDLLDKLQDFFSEFHSFDFLGTVVPVLPRRGAPHRPAFGFFLVDILPSDEPLQMIRATCAEIEQAKSMITNLTSSSGGILAYIKETLINVIGIMGIDEAPLLETSLEFTILQSLSDGYDESRSLSHKLHSLIVGSPAVGKKLLTEAAHILNPVCTEAHPGKITVPGIAGTAVRRDGKWTSDPGLIPLAHRGTFVIQDFHHLKRKLEIMGTFSMVMEDGYVIDGTAANKKHRALTSIHLDMNKKTHIRLSDESSLSSAAERLDDLGVSQNVLTRFDYIVDIPRDTNRQIEIALRMHSESKQTKRQPAIRRHSTKGRELQVLVAYLRTVFAEVRIPEELATGYLRPKQEELLDANRDQLEQSSLLGDYQTRLSNSIHKFIFAIARGNARFIANEADVDEAFRFVATKLEFLRSIEPFEVPANWKAGVRPEKVVKRHAFIREYFGGTDTSVNDVYLTVMQNHDTTVSKTTIRRDLKEIGCAQRHGVFRIDPDQTAEMAK